MCGEEFVLLGYFKLFKKIVCNLLLPGAFSLGLLYFLFLLAMNSAVCFGFKKKKELEMTLGILLFLINIK